MKLIANREALLQALRGCGKVVQVRTPRPVLACVKMSAKGKVLALSATDMERAIIWPLSQVDISADGEALIPHAKFLSIVEAVGSDILTLEMVGDKLAIRFDNGEFGLIGMRVEEFPPIECKSDASATMEATELIRILDGTLHNASRDLLAMAQLCGVYFAFNESPCCFVSTSGYTMSKATGGNFQALKPVTIPLATLEILYDLVESVGATVVHFHQSKAWNRMQFVVKSEDLGDGVTFASPILEGQFVPYENIMWKESETSKASVNRLALLSACNQASINASRDSKFGAKIDLIFKDDKCVVKGLSEGGEGFVSVASEVVGGITISVSEKFLVPCLKALTSETVSLGFLNEMKPFYIRGESGLVQMCMPKKGVE